jgi:uncharacterized membrane protein
MKATEEQLAYATLLDVGMKVGLVMLVLTFIVYVFGILTPHIPVNDLPKYWAMPVKEYLKATDIHPGWAWLANVGKGDFLNFLGIAFLSAVTIICYMRIIPILMKKKDSVYTALAVIEVLVLVLAASGILRGGGH